MEVVRKVLREVPLIDGWVRIVVVELVNKSKTALNYRHLHGSLNVHFQHFLPFNFLIAWFNRIQWMEIESIFNLNNLLVKAINFNFLNLHDWYPFEVIKNFFFIAEFYKKRKYFFYRRGMKKCSHHREGPRLSTKNITEKEFKSWVDSTHSINLILCSFTHESTMFCYQNSNRLFLWYFRPSPSLYLYLLLPVMTNNIEK